MSKFILYKKNIVFLLFRYHNLVKDVRQNKGSILRATVEYIKVLKDDQGRQRQLEEKLKFQEFQQRKLLRILQVLMHFSTVYGREDKRR